MENPYLAAKGSFKFQKRSKKMLLHQRANPANHKQKSQEKINMLIMTSQCETSGKYNILNLLSKNLEPPEYNLSTRERTLTGTSSILVGSKSRVLPTDPFSTKYNYRAGRAVLTVMS